MAAKQLHVVYRQSLFFRENDVDENGIHVKEYISSMTVGLLFFIIGFAR